MNRKSSNKKITQSGIPTDGSKEGSKELDNEKNLTYYVEMMPDNPEYNLSFDPTLPTKRILKISTLAKLGIGAKYEDIKKLPIERQKEFFAWYQKEIEDTKAENLQVFLLQILASNAAESYRENYESVLRLVDNPNTPQSDIDNALEFYQKIKQKFNEAQKLLNEEIDHDLAIKLKP